MPELHHYSSSSLFVYDFTEITRIISTFCKFQEKSLTEYPNPDAGDYFNYEDEKIKAEIEKRERLYARFAGDTLNYGLSRNPEKAYPDKY